MANPPASHYPDIGDLGEDLVAQWLQSTGWLILHQRFYSRWGEIDIIAQYDGRVTQDSTLAFVEVKTRSPGNWDSGGRSAITAKKQAKLWRTAEMFLANYPEKADYPCRFDVAIVSCQRVAKNFSERKFTQKALASSLVDGYELQLQEYIPAAFDSVVDNT
ncbi:MAG: YraN family protein [Aulosira sp. ZfuVER01]|nr:YraN family protein [Aulosira sp. ZfuVER01]MDZ8001297.1 YraN family protein [Aulosira sp. DedVER01a]MDZ8050954.1 YraN family protein [Aulosira sp. ZfuCHP01]